MATIAPLGLVGTTPFYRLEDKSVIWLCGGDSDGDGISGNIYGDPDYQDNTTLQYDGCGLNAEFDRWGVVPPEIIDAVPETVMGCLMKATNVVLGLTFPGVVGDRGPAGKLGEFSVAYLRALGIPSSPVSGGTQQPIIAVQIWPGVPSVVNGKQYALQPSR
jgi:hypothetical protein